MTLYTFFSFVAFLLYLQAAMYFSRLMPGTKANRLFVLVLASLATISAFIFSRQFIHNIQVIYMLDRFAVISWISFPLLATSYVTVASGSHVNKKIMYLIHFVLVPIAVFLSARYIVHPQSLKEFYMAESGLWYFNTNIRALWTIMAIIYGFLNALPGIYVVYLWMKRSKSANCVKDMIKTRLIFASVIFFAVFSLTSVIIAPLTEKTQLPSLMHIVALLPMSVIFLTSVLLHPKAYFPEMVSNLFMKRIKEFVFYLDHNGKIYSVNDYTLELLGYLLLEMVNKEVGVFFKPSKIISQQIEDVAMNRPGRQVISLLNPKSNDPITVSLSVTKVYDTFRNMLGFVVIARDYRQTHELYKESKARVRKEQRLVAINKELEKRITARESTLIYARDKLRIEQQMQQETEQKLINELKTKEKILYEIHHRVKNNMQIIVSLINLEQHKDGTREHVQKLFSKLAGRVRDISVIHDFLYDAPYLGKINFTHFLQRTTNDLKGRFSRIKNLFFNISATQDLITIDQAIPCGIIVFELLYNSLQHAYSVQGHSGSKKQHSIDPAATPAIHIEYFKKNDQYFLNVSDNGNGIALQDGKPLNKSIGLSLVELLVNDYLKGAINYAAKNGTKISIRFSASATSVEKGSN